MQRDQHVQSHGGAIEEHSGNLGRVSLWKHCERMSAMWNGSCPSSWACILNTLVATESCEQID